MPNSESRHHDYRQEFIDVRGLQYRVNHWNSSEPSLPKLFLMHGWMDCGVSFSYLAEHLKGFHLIAPDWRGFGETDRTRESSYWFLDYLADLDVLLDHFSPRHPANLVGHSMGGNVVLQYSGARPDRVNKVLSLDALGMNDVSAEQGVERLRDWMNQQRFDPNNKIYRDYEQLMFSLAKSHPYLQQTVIEDLARWWGQETSDGMGVQLKGDMRHQWRNPYRYRHEDTLALWQQVTAEVAIVLGDASFSYQQYTEKQEAEQSRLEQAIEVLRIKPEHVTVLEQAHHMMHLERPKEVADILRGFFSNE